MKIYLVYAVRSRSGRYVTFELVTRDLQAAIDRYDFLKAGGGSREEQENYPQFDWAGLELDESSDITTSVESVSCNCPLCAGISGTLEEWG